MQAGNRTMYRASTNINNLHQTSGQGLLPMINTEIRNPKSGHVLMANVMCDDDGYHHNVCNVSGTYLCPLCITLD